MASTYIEIKAEDGRLASQVRSLIDATVRLQADYAHIKEVMDQVAFGGDFTALAAALGLESTADAEAIYNLIGSANSAEIHGSFLTQIAGRMG